MFLNLAFSSGPTIVGSSIEPLIEVSEDEEDNNRNNNNNNNNSNKGPNKEEKESANYEKKFATLSRCQYYKKLVLWITDLVPLSSG